MSKLALGGMIGVVLVLAALATGCGGGGDSTASSTTKAQFLKKGNAICEKGEVERLAAMEAEYQAVLAKKLSEGEIQERMLTVSLRPYDQTVSKLSELEAPAGEEEKVEALIQAMEEASKASHAHPQEALKGGITFRNADKLLNDYGLDKCDLIGA